MIEFKNDYSQLWGRWHWYSFHFVHIYFERDFMPSGYEFGFMILGLGFRIRINDKDGEEQIKKWLKEI